MIEKRKEKIIKREESKKRKEKEKEEIKKKMRIRKLKNLNESKSKRKKVEYDDRLRNFERNRKIEREKKKEKMNGMIKKGIDKMERGEEKVDIGKFVKIVIRGEYELKKKEEEIDLRIDKRENIR